MSKHPIWNHCGISINTRSSLLSMNFYISTVALLIQGGWPFRRLQDSKGKPITPEFIESYLVGIFQYLEDKVSLSLHYEWIESQFWPIFQPSWNFLFLPRKKRISSMPFSCMDLSNMRVWQRTRPNEIDIFILLSEISQWKIWHFGKSFSVRCNRWKEMN